MKQRHYATTKLPCSTMSLSLIGFRMLASEIAMMGQRSWLRRISTQIRTGESFTRINSCLGVSISPSRMTGQSEMDLMETMRSSIVIACTHLNSESKVYPYFDVARALVNNKFYRSDGKIDR